MGSTIHLPDQEIARALTTDDFLASCHEALQLYGSGDLVNPPRRAEVWREGQVDRSRLEMTAEWRGVFRARKVIDERSDVETGRLGERTAVIELEDLASGARARLDAEHITNMRTGAAGALGARYLGPVAIERAAILGTGRIARALALCVDRAIRPSEIVATSRSSASRSAFEADVGDEVDAGIRTVDSIAACVRDAQAVFAAVPTPEPILGLDGVGEDTHLSVLGGDTRTAQLDVDLLCRRTVVVDHPDQAPDSGDLRIARAEGRYGDIDFACDAAGRVMTIGDAAMGSLERLRGRGAIAYFTGLAAQDLHAAAVAYRRVVLGKDEG